MQKSYKTTVIGLSLILLAVLLILCCVFIPRIQAKAKLREVLAAFSDAEAQYVLYTDPHYQNEGLLTQNGREVRLEGESLQAVLGLLERVGADCRYEGKQKNALVGADDRLLVKAAAGDSTQLFLTDECLYFTKGETTYYFEARDGKLWQELQTALSATVE